MRIARAPEELPAGRRAVALGTFDGVHRGHRRVLDAARANDGLVSTAVTFWPHPRTALGNRVELLTSLERRLELLEAAGIGSSMSPRRPASRRSSSSGAGGSSSSTTSPSGSPVEVRAVRATSVR